jgi:cystathionine gamma-synthase
MADAGLRTIIAQLGGHRDTATGAVVPAVQPAVTYARGPGYEPIAGHIYARYGHPGAEAVEEVMRLLDGAAATLAFDSGMAAAICWLETLPRGSHVVFPEGMFHGTHEWLHHLRDRGSVEVTGFPGADLEAIAAALRPGETSAVWIETPLNPTWGVIDIAAAADIAHAAGAVLVVDSTVAPPVTTRPLALGADVVIQSATKYLNGHADVLAGILSLATEEARDELFELRGLTGGTIGPFEAWLLLRGLRTLDVRYARISETAHRLAAHFAADPRVERVLYPGLESHPGHAVARRQMTGGYGGMLSLLVAGGGDAARAAASRTRVFIPATSLGGVESLIEHRATVEGPGSRVPPSLLRLSIGLEDGDDLIADLDRALG